MVKFFRQCKPALGGDDGAAGSGAENPVYGDGGNFRDVGGKDAEHILQMLHLHAPVALLNGVAYRPGDGVEPLPLTAQLRKIGRASCRERV